MIQPTIPSTYFDFAGHRFVGPAFRPWYMPPKPGVLVVVDVQAAGLKVIGVCPEETLMLAMQREQPKPHWNDQVRGRLGFAYMVIEDDQEAIGVAIETMREVAYQEWLEDRHGQISPLLLPKPCTGIPQDISAVRRR